MLALTLVLALTQVCSCMSSGPGRFPDPARSAARAGNYGSNSDVVDTPTNFGLDIMVSVAASDLQDAIPAYSNYGAGRVHLAAPGSEILSTVPNGRYYVLSGARLC